MCPGSPPIGPGDKVDFWRPGDHVAVRVVRPVVAAELPPDASALEAARRTSDFPLAYADAFVTRTARRLVRG